MTEYSPDLNGLLPRVKAALAEHLAREEGQVLEEFEGVKIIKRPYSSVAILDLRTSAGRRRLVMKTIAHHPVNRAMTERENQAVVEYGILERLYPKFQGVEGCRVPRPVMVLPEAETYLMDFVEGHHLAEEHRYCRLFSSRAGFERLRRNYRYCGKWLAHFQGATGVRASGAREALKGVLERLGHRLKLIEESRDRRCPPDFRRRVEELVEREIRKIGGEEVRVCGRHSDFGPWNILAGSDGITVIDFFGYEDDALPVDVLKVLVYLEDEKQSPAGSRRRLAALQESFLEGYGDFPYLPFPALVVTEAMQRVVSIWGSIQNAGRRLTDRFKAHRRLLANRDWLLDERKRIVLAPDRVA